MNIGRYNKKNEERKKERKSKRNKTELLLLKDGKADEWEWKNDRKYRTDHYSLVLFLSYVNLTREKKDRTTLKSYLLSSSSDFLLFLFGVRQILKT